MEEKKANVRGPSKTSKEDWLRIATEILIHEGVSQVKVLSLASHLNCARSSFYWYFKNRTELLDALLEYWAGTNTEAIVESAKKPAPTLNLALINIYSEWVSGECFNPALDFAIRDWARRSRDVHTAVERSDNTRLQAISAMFMRHGFAVDDAETRARTLYFSMIGIDTLDKRISSKPDEKQLGLFFKLMSGLEPTERELAELFREFKNVEELVPA